MLSAWKRTMLCLVLSTLCCIFPYQSEAGQKGIPQTNLSIPTNETHARFATLKKLIDQFQKDAKARKRRLDIATQTFQPEALILATDRDPVDVLLRRTEALLAHLKSMPGIPDLSAEENRLAELKIRNTKFRQKTLTQGISSFSKYSN